MDRDDLPPEQVADLSPLQLVRLVLRRQPRPSRPARRVYSSTGYLILGMVLEKAGKGSLDAVLRRLVLSPAGMQDTSVTALYPRRAVRGYEYGEDVTLEQLGWAGGALGAVSSATDLDRFLTALFGGRLISEGDLERMRSMRPLESGGRYDYGLGLISQRLSCGEAQGHHGGLGGITSEAWVMPERHRTVVAMVNANPSIDLLTPLVDTALCR